MDAAYEAVKEFQQAFGHPVAEAPTFMDSARLSTRVAWMDEEIKELEEATTLIGQVDAIIDLLYFCLGTLVEMGVPPQAFFDIVHSANMGKLWGDGRPRFREEDGKVIKPEGWETPEPKMLEVLQQLQV